MGLVVMTAQRKSLAREVAVGTVFVKSMRMVLLKIHSLVFASVRKATMVQIAKVFRVPAQHALEMGSVISTQDFVAANQAILAQNVQLPVLLAAVAKAPVLAIPQAVQLVIATLVFVEQIAASL